MALSLLVLTDFFQPANCALAYAATLAGALGARLVLLHVHRHSVLHPELLTGELATRHTEAENLAFESLVRSLAVPAVAEVGPGRHCQRRGRRRAPAAPAHAAGAAGAGVMRYGLFIALLLAGGVLAQTKPIRPDQVPPLAFVALQELYPQARQVQWELATGPLYRANFTQNHTRQGALFSSNGDLAATAVAMAPPALPAPVRHALATYYPGLKLQSVARMRNAATGALTYEAQLLDNGTACTVLYGPDGHEVRKGRSQ